ncbi:MAG: hypothetical protein K9J13_02575 [Saprospiraceae bacterium]|nr:hypothetical protein [Saprospiraceae bacterium]
MTNVILIVLVLIAITIIVIGIIANINKRKSEKICRTVDITSGDKKIGCICGGEDETKCQFYKEHHDVEPSV